VLGGMKFPKKYRGSRDTSDIKLPKNTKNTGGAVTLRKFGSSHPLKKRQKNTPYRDSGDTYTGTAVTLIQGEP